MATPTTLPSVADLMRTREHGARTRALHLAVPGIEGLLITALSDAVAPAVRVLRRVIVETPTHRVHVPLVIERAGRRVAILPDDAATPESAEDAATLLVFGVFDAVYRVRRQALVCSVPGTAWEIARHERELFDPESLHAMKLRALPGRSSGERPMRDRSPRSGVVGGSVPDVRVMRLKCSTEWADAFERAMRSAEAARAPLFARSA